MRYNFCEHGDLGDEPLRAADISAELESHTDLLI